ncbi:hypothetical protein FOZ63_010976, partial [Perkinsus olseni]
FAHPFPSNRLIRGLILATLASAERLDDVTLLSKIDSGLWHLFTTELPPRELLCVRLHPRRAAVFSEPDPRMLGSSGAVFERGLQPNQVSGTAPGDERQRLADKRSGLDSQLLQLKQVAASLSEKTVEATEDVTSGRLLHSQSTQHSRNAKLSEKWRESWQLR